jgi:MATE family multidrug resistance protein
MAVLASIQYYFRYRIGWVFSNEPAVIALVASLVYIVALFAVADGLQSGLAGVFRGMGQQKIVVGLNLLGFWIIGLPVGVVLTFHEGGDWFGLQGEAGEGMGLPGVYWGLNFGLFSTGIIGTVVMSRMDWVEMARQARARVGASGDAADGVSKEGSATSAIIKDDGCAAAAAVCEGSNEGTESRDGMSKA